MVLSQEQQDSSNMREIHLPTQVLKLGQYLYPLKEMFQMLITNVFEQIPILLGLLYPILQKP